MDARGQAEDYGEWLGRWNRNSLSSRSLHQHQATTHAAGQDSSFERSLGGLHVALP